MYLLALLKLELLEVYCFKFRINDMKTLIDCLVRSLKCSYHTIVTLGFVLALIN